MKQTELNLRDIFGELKHRAIWILLAVLLFTGAAFYYAKTTTVQTYTATSTLFVTSTDRSSELSITLSDINTSSRLVSTYLVLLRSDRVLSKVAESLSQPGVTSAAIRNMMTAKAVGDTEELEVAVSHRDPQLAISVANKIVEVAPAEIYQIAEAGKAEIVDKAAVALADSNSIATTTIIGGIVGFILSSLVIILLFIFNTKIWDESDLEKRYDIPILGTIPHIRISSASVSTKKGADQ